MFAYCKAAHGMANQTPTMFFLDRWLCSRLELLKLNLKKKHLGQIAKTSGLIPSH